MNNPDSNETASAVMTPTSYFDGEIVSYHAVSGCQISVHKLLGVQIRHAVCYLSSHLDHLLQGGWWTPRVVLQNSQCHCSL